MSHEPLDERLADRLLTGRPLPADREDLTDLAVFVAAMRSEIDHAPVPSRELARILDAGVAPPTPAELAASRAAERPVLTGLEVSVELARSARGRLPVVLALRARHLMRVLALLARHVADVVGPHSRHLAGVVRLRAVHVAVVVTRRWQRAWITTQRWVRDRAPVVQERTASFRLVSRRTGRILKVAVANVAAMSLIAQAGLAGGAVATATVLAGAAGVLPTPVHERVATVVSAVTPFELPSRTTEPEPTTSSEGASDVAEADAADPSTPQDGTGSVEDEGSRSGGSAPVAPNDAPGPDDGPDAPRDRSDAVRNQTPSTNGVPDTATDTPGGSGSAPGSGGSAPGSGGSAPGSGGSAPGSSGSAPGNSGSAPGNSGSTPGQSGGSASGGGGGGASGNSGGAPANSGNRGGGGSGGGGGGGGGSL